MPFPHYPQPDGKDCGPTCLRIISKFYGKVLPLQTLRNLSETTREGSSLLGLSEAAESLGFKTLGVKINFKTLKNEVPLPCIVHWNKAHFVVVYSISGEKLTISNFWKKSKTQNSSFKISVSDPAFGLLSYTQEEFIKGWIGANADEETEEGIALLLETTPKFHQNEWEEKETKRSLSFLYTYLRNYKQLLYQLIIGMAGASVLSLLFPFLTQSIVDIGIQNQDLNFIYLILIAQLMLFLGQTGIDIIRSWILLHLSTRINISIVSDFFIKLMKLPISFFDTRMTGDIMQRINDHHRIENLLTSSSLSTLFSLVNLLVFSLVLIFYNLKLFLIFLAGSALYLLWILFFLKHRRELDYKRFSQISEEQSKVIELINGMQEIKLHNAERQKRWNWEFVQIKLFKISMKSLSLEQGQTVGSNFINQLKNILITFTSASLVLSGNITLGMMLSVQYIIGQMDSPMAQLVSFIRQVQDAKISLERLGEIHGKEDEDAGMGYAPPYQLRPNVPIENLHTSVPSASRETQNSKIIIQNLFFRYTGSDSYVFENLNLEIPLQKTTAIVGASGSGKTTLLKLLMKFYDPNKGEIKLENTDLKNISPRTWRAHCGVVMQESYVFNDTIAGNIAVGEDYIDKGKLLKAVETANIKDFIETLPLSYNTKIGNEGVGISGGQRQRLFIARAVYKNPDFLFFDEATSSLDADNERIIMENLENFFKGKTAVVIAHRLSTVKNADQIVVLKSGKVVENGTHAELTAKKGEYYRLVKNQLELGN